MEKTLIIKSTEGLHAALASKIVQAASKYEVDIRLEYKNNVVDAKSILGLMSLAVPFGENVKLVCTGAKADIALTDIEKVLA